MSKTKGNGPIYSQTRKEHNELKSSECITNSNKQGNQEQGNNETISGVSTYLHIRIFVMKYNIAKKRGG
jgi:hypothetical protein